jgi:polyisoprenoid-binding protein YceI
VRYTVDRAHTDVEFAVRHMGIATVRGRFTDFTGQIEVENGQLKSASAEIQVASIHTREEQRDQHLRSADFFDVEHHPTLTFRSTAIEPKGDGRYAVKGDLTIRGTTHPVTFDAEVTPEAKDPWGKQRVGFRITGEIDRRQFGLNWNTVLDTGGLLVGERVRIEVEGEAVAD